MDCDDVPGNIVKEFELASIHEKETGENQDLEAPDIAAGKQVLKKTADFGTLADDQPTQGNENHIEELDEYGLPVQKDIQDSICIERKIGMKYNRRSMSLK